MNKQTFLKGDLFENFSTSDLIKLVDDGHLLERARAIFFLAKRCDREEKIIFQVRAKIFDPKNREAKIFGITVSFLGIGGLFEANTPQTKKFIDDFIKTLSKYEYENLIYFLNSIQ